MEEPIKLRVCQLFAALSHPRRLEIVELLIDKELSVGEISTTTGIGQSGTSQHLSYLARAGILTSTTSGTSRRYRVRGPRVAQILTLIMEFCQTHGLYGDADLTDDEGVSRG